MWDILYVEFVYVIIIVSGIYLLNIMKGFIYGRKLDIIVVWNMYICISYEVLISKLFFYLLYFIFF